jgi:hypothetical protein
MRRLILAGWALAGAVLGQKVEFEVASIRPAEPGSGEASAVVLGRLPQPTTPPYPLLSRISWWTPTA